MNEANVIQLLQNLEKFEILKYQPRQTNPRLTFLTPRFDGKDITLSDEIYKERHADSKRRLEALITYIQNNTKCRSRQLLAYFDEEIANRCGKCDVCIERNKVDLSEYQFDSIIDKIKPVLKEEPKDLKSLALVLNDTSEEKIIKVVQWLLDNDKIIYDENKLLRWNNP